MLAIIAAALPIILEMIKLIFAAPSDKRADVAKDIMDDLAKIRAAIQKSQETEGDTSELEEIINHRKP
jgi:hypothetical protein